MSDAQIVSIDRAAAERLTERIRTDVATAGERLASAGERLREAQEKRAWEVMGYDTWAAYLQSEFGMLPANARRLVVQANVTKELGQAAGIDLPSDVVSARAANDVAPQVDKLSEKIATATKGKPREHRPAIVRKVVAEERAQCARSEGESPAQEPVLAKVATQQAPRPGHRFPPIPPPKENADYYSDADGTTFAMLEVPIRADVLREAHARAKAQGSNLREWTQKLVAREVAESAARSTAFVPARDRGVSFPKGKNK